MPRSKPPHCAGCKPAVSCRSGTEDSAAFVEHRIPLFHAIGLCRQQRVDIAIHRDFLDRVTLLDRIDHVRSEERRVGKECRSRWGRDYGKKKMRDMEGA